MVSAALPNDRHTTAPAPEADPDFIDRTLLEEFLSGALTAAGPTDPAAREILAHQFVRVWPAAENTPADVRELTAGVISRLGMTGVLTWLAHYRGLPGLVPGLLETEQLAQALTALPWVCAEIPSAPAADAPPALVVAWRGADGAAVLSNLGGELGLLVASREFPIATELALGILDLVLAALERPRSMGVPVAELSKALLALRSALVANRDHLQELERWPDPRGQVGL